jgi:hypothetical protein
MGGSVFFVVLVAVIMFVLAVLMSPLFIIPAVVVLGVGLFSGPLLAAIGRGGGRDSGGTPTTSEASYEPVQQP